MVFSGHTRLPLKCFIHHNHTGKAAIVCVGVFSLCFVVYLVESFYRSEEERETELVALLLL